MKKALKSIVVMALAQFVAGNAMAVGGSDGTRGGGQVVREGSQLQLRDLVDPSVCENKDGTELRKENPEIDRILGRLARLDWYFAAGLKFEIDQLQVCMTRELIRLRDRDWSSVIEYRPKELEQAAIRFLDSYDVYLNKEIYASLSSRDRAYLIVHEAIHSFIPSDAPRRSERVREAVKAISKVDSGAIGNAAKLRAELNRAAVEYPWSAQELQGSRRAIEFALSAVEDQESALLAGDDLNPLLTVSTPGAIGLVYRTHRERICQGGAEHLARVLRDGERRLFVLDRLLNGIDAGSIEGIDPLMVAFSVAEAVESPEFSRRILASRAMKAGPKFFASMGRKNLAMNRMRIMGTEGFRMLGIADMSRSVSPVEIPALAVRPYNLDERDLVPSEVMGLIRFVVWQLNVNPEGWEAVRSFMSRNESFYEAFGVTRLRQTLEGMSAPVAREKSAVFEALPELVRGFRVLLADEISRRVGGDASRRLDQEVDWARLGLTN